MHFARREVHVDVPLPLRSDQLHHGNFLLLLCCLLGDHTVSRLGGGVLWLCRTKNLSFESSVLVTDVVASDRSPLSSKLLSLTVGSTPGNALSIIGRFGLA